MNKRFFALLCLCVFINTVYAQVLPEDGGILHYRLIGFSPFSEFHSCDYILQIASGNISTDGAFDKNIIKTVSGKSAHIILEVPEFGRDYTWRVTTIKDGGLEPSGRLYHFQTLALSSVDSSVLRVRIMKQAEKYKNAYVLLDGNKAMYNMGGKLVWYLPDNKHYDYRYISSDLKVSPTGTLTFLNGENALEVNYNGDVLWKAPNDGRISGTDGEHYHHEFTKLANGHYMVLGNQPKYAHIVVTSGKELITFSNQNQGLEREDSNAKLVTFGTIIEYDKQGNIVWEWKCSDYFAQSDLATYKPENGADVTSNIMNMHDNSFYFDENEKLIYMSFKNISRIIKIKYPEGTVVNEYGERYITGRQVSGNGLFCNQHACRRSSIGCLFLFNNNGCSPGGLPKIKKLVEPVNSGQSLIKIWEYNCTVEPGAPDVFPRGGNVCELPDQSLFVCMGSTYSKLFIVDTGKKVLWSAIPEKWNKEKEMWQPQPQYRASIINDPAQLEQLIFNTEKHIK